MGKHFFHFGILCFCPLFDFVIEDLFALLSPSQSIAWKGKRFLSLLIECFSNFWLSQIGLVDGLTFLLPDFRNGERIHWNASVGQNMCLSLSGLFRPLWVGRG